MRSDWYDDPEGRPGAVGMVLVDDRGSLPFALVHGEPLVACAALALQDAQVESIDSDTPWGLVVERLEETGEVLVLHDSLCPLVPPDFLARCVLRAVGGDSVVAAHRPVTDTLKEVADGTVGATRDRDGFRTLCSPVVLPTRVVAGLQDRPGTDLVALLARLVEAGEPVDWVEAPAEARRVASADDVRLLEALTAPR